jgi:dienelactone hydrolase
VEVKVPSHDGTLVPLSIVYPKAMKLDGLNPTLLYGYGAYGYALGPEFDFTRLAWYERGGVNATCHVRGGGEYGEEWHHAGKGATKPNTWLDFIACAHYLIEKKYTSPSRLAGQGASMGGIMIGRTITDRPDLFAAILVDAGVPDMLRAEATELIDAPEVGNSKTEAGFKALYAMSPYHFVKDGTPYPAALFTAGMNDSRLKPWQSAKMVARLQAATNSGKPVLLYVDYAGGHDVGNTAAEYQARLANSWSFLMWQFGAPNSSPVRHDEARLARLFASGTNLRGFASEHKRHTINEFRSQTVARGLPSSPVRDVFALCKSGMGDRRPKNGPAALATGNGSEASCSDRRAGMPVELSISLLPVSEMAIWKFSGRRAAYKPGLSLAGRRVYVIAWGITYAFIQDWTSLDYLSLPY